MLVILDYLILFCTNLERLFQRSPVHHDLDRCVTIAEHLASNLNYFGFGGFPGNADEEC